MEVLVYLVPMALALGLLGLGGFLWSLKTGQYDDLDGAAWRAILDEDDASPAVRMAGEKAPDGDKSAGPA
jgi:cbb3-type cytochrome oxidase maturation protein